MGNWLKFEQKIKFNILDLKLRFIYYISIELVIKFLIFYHEQLSDISVGANIDYPGEIE